MSGAELPPTQQVLEQAAARVGRPDYDAWAARLANTGWCALPVRLKGHIDHVDPATGEATRAFTSANQPDRVLLKACSARRATRCPACAAVYRSDARALILAGLVGGKGMSAEVTHRPLVFLTLTAPSFGAVHTTHPDNTACHPATTCPHKVICHRTHQPGDPDLGTPLCDACYDWEGTVIFNARSTELWRRTIIATRRALATQQGIPVRHLDREVTVAFVKIVEYQARGVAHFHALLRVDPATDTNLTSVDGQLLATAVRIAAARTTCPNPYRPRRPIRWGTQTDITIVPSENRARLAGYLAKYTTKSVDTNGTLDRRLTNGNHDHTPGPRHLHRLAETAWNLANEPGLGSLNLRYWAHTLGYRGHWLTKSRHWSTTLTQLRADRYRWRENQDGTDYLIPYGDFEYAGTGHTTPGDTWLAAIAADSKRRQRRIAWEER